MEWSESSEMEWSEVMAGKISVPFRRDGERDKEAMLEIPLKALLSVHNANFLFATTPDVKLKIQHKNSQIST